MSRTTILPALLMLAVVCWLGGASAYADAGHATGEPAVQPIRPDPDTGAGAPDKLAKAQQYFTDLPVVNQHGEELRFFSDVLKDRIVLISLFFTDCDRACPLTTDKMAEVQKLLGNQLGESFFMISITLDPQHDTPPVIKEYADQFKAGRGWLFLTGAPDDLKTITYRLGHTSSQIDMHNTYFMLGDVNAARWRKVEPNLAADAIVLHLRDIAKLPL